MPTHLPIGHIMITASVKSGHMHYACTTPEDYARMCATFAPVREALPERTAPIGSVTATWTTFVKPGATTYADTYVTVATLTRTEV